MKKITLPFPYRRSRVKQKTERGKSSLFFIAKNIAENIIYMFTSETN